MTLLPAISSQGHCKKPNSASGQEAIFLQQVWGRLWRSWVQTRASWRRPGTVTLSFLSIPPFHLGSRSVFWESRASPRGQQPTHGRHLPGCTWSGPQHQSLPPWRSQVQPSLWQPAKQVPHFKDSAAKPAYLVPLGQKAYFVYRMGNAIMAKSWVVGTQELKSQNRKRNKPETLP